VEIPSNAAEGEYYITGITQAVVGNAIIGPHQTAGDDVITVVSAGTSPNGDTNPSGAADAGNHSVGIISIDVNDSEENNQAIGAQAADVADPVETGTFEDGRRSESVGEFVEGDGGSLQPHQLTFGHNEINFVRVLSPTTRPINTPKSFPASGAIT